MNRRGAFILLALTLLAYAPAMRGGFIWDDDDHVTNNANLRSLEGLERIWLEPRSLPQYYPLTHTSFWIEYQLWGQSSAGYHIVNILLHAASAILLWRILTILEFPTPLLAACLFAIHPVQTESVAWVSERKNILSGVFYFASALMYFTAIERDVILSEAKDPRQHVSTPRSFAALRMTAPAYFGALALFVAALLSKTVTCSLPAAMLLVLWWKRGRLSDRDWLSLLPMFVIGLAMASLTWWLEREHVLAKGLEWDYSILDRILIAGRAVWFYFSKLLLPLNLAFIYPKWPIDPRAPWQWAFPLGVVVALLVLWQMRDRWGRGPIVAALFFLGTLVPALGFFNVYPMRYSLVADHFQYLACIAPLALLAYALHRVLKSDAARFAILAPLLMLTIWRSSIFTSSERLWRDTLAKNPNSWMVHLNYAKSIADDPARDAEAARHFELQAQLAPNLPETHWNLAVNLARRGLLDEAIAEYTRAIDVDPMFPQAHFGRATIYLEQNKPLEAKIDLERAIQLKPDFANAHLVLAKLLAQEKRHDEAIAHYRAAIAADPSLAEAYVNLAALLVAKGQMSEARDAFERGVQINPELERFRGRVLSP